MTSVTSSFSEAEILSAALSVSLDYDKFKLNDVKRELIGCRHLDYRQRDSHIRKITGEKISAILRAHPDLFGFHCASNGRIQSFYRTGEVMA